jgi:hypothetical protein
MKDEFPSFPAMKRHKGGIIKALYDKVKEIEHGGLIPVPPVQVFKSTLQTGTGQVEDISHDLGVTPTIVIIQVEEFAVPSGGATLAVAEGNHTTQLIRANVTAGVKYRVKAVAIG